MVALLAALALTSAACGPDPGVPGIGVLNNTGQTIVVSYAVNGEEQPITEGDGGALQDSEMRKFSLDIFDPGKPDNCTTGDIVVRSLDGDELDRFPPPECDGRVLRALDRRAPLD